MNRNPFIPQPSYPVPQPPLPPGPPPPQPAQPDYSAYWAAAAHQQHPQQQAQPGAYNPQWSQPQVAPPRPPAEQNPLYANYGYGNQWQRQQQQQQQQRQLQQAQATPQQYPSIPPQRSQPPPPPMPAYSPYHPMPAYPSHPSTYMPPRVGQPPGSFNVAPTGGPSMFAQSMQSQQPQQQPLRHPHPSQTLPPAKRQRFEGPQAGTKLGAPLGQFQQGHQPNAGASFTGGNRGGGGGRGGLPSRGNNIVRGRGVNRGGGVNLRGGSRGGSFSANAHPNNRGGSSLRGHGSRGNFNNSSRRGNNAFPNSSFRGRPLGSSNGVGRRDGNVSNASLRKEENRRTLTDFKFEALEIQELGWTWGVIPTVDEPAALSREPSLAPTIKEEEPDTVLLPEPPENNVDAASSTGATPPSRLRIYFHTPVTPDDSHPMAPSLSVIPSNSRKGKRKKAEDDDGEIENDRARPPPPGLNDDRSSVAASATETGSEGDWLMAAIVQDRKENADTDSQPTEEQEAVKDEVAVQSTEEQEQQQDETNDESPDDTGQSPTEMPADGEKKPSPRPSSEPTEKLHNQSFESNSSLVIDQNEQHAVSEILFSPNESETSAVEQPILHAVPEIHSVSTIELPTDSFVSPPDQVVPLEDSLQDVADVVPETQQDDDPTVTPLFEDDVATTPDTQTQLDEDTQATLVEHDQTNLDHLPEPPASNSSQSGQSGGDGPETKPLRVPSANRLSISYASGQRRLVVDAEAVDELKIFRKEGRIEITVSIVSDGEELRGILIEGLSDVTKAYSALESTAVLALTDPTVPPFARPDCPSKITLNVYLDTVRPLSEPKWVKTGDTQEWLRSMFGRMFWAAGDAADGWEKKINIVDPDPPPTIWSVMDAWAGNSAAGNLLERQRFIKTHMSESDNLVEILLRLVRGERATPFTSGPVLSASNVAGPLLSAMASDFGHSGQQTHVSLAVLAMFRMTVEYATKAEGESGKKDVEDRMGEIIRCLPSHLLYKSLDGIFKEWKAEAHGKQ